jgi:hypothetical protein
MYSDSGAGSTHLSDNFSQLIGAVSGVGRFGAESPKHTVSTE